MARRRATQYIPRQVLEDSASLASDRQATVAGDGAPIRIIYGQDRVGGQIAGCIVSGNYMYLLAVWCYGEIDSINSPHLYDAALDGSISVNHHYGTLVQGVDSILSGLLGGSYTDTLPGVAYSVFKIPAALANGFPTVSAVIKGLKVASSSGGATAWSDCPAYAIAHYVENTIYGMRRSIDWASVATVAAQNNQVIGGEKRRLINLTIDRVQDVDRWLQTLCAYAGCIPFEEGGIITLISNAPAASVATFTSANIVEGSLSLTKRGVRNVPTRVRVRYTNTAVIPYREAYATAYASGVLAGTTPLRDSQVDMPGVNRCSQALREAIERLNMGTLNDLTVKFRTFDPQLTCQLGDIITVTHPLGLTSKLFRISALETSDYARYDITADEYDAAAYSDSVAATPSTPDTTSDSTLYPPQVTGLTLNEELYQLRDGTWASRMRASWSLPSYAYVDHFLVKVWNGGVIIAQGNVGNADTTFATPPVQDGQSYQVDVYIVTKSLSISTVASATKTAVGKILPPIWPVSPTPLLTGFEAGGKVFLWWPKANDLDTVRYELRYGLTSGSWAAATVIDRIDALNKVVEGLPAGSWRFYVDALDSVGNYTGTPLTRDISITLDTNAFLANSYTFGSPTLTNVTALTARDGTLSYATDFGDGLGFGHVDTNNSTGAWIDANVPVGTALVNPHTAGTSTYQSESWTLSQSLTGNFTAVVNLVVNTGTVDLILQTSPDNAAWTDWVGGTARATCRYIRVKVSGTGTFYITGTPSARLDAVPREEVGSVTTNAGSAVTVTLANHYASTKTIQLTPQGTAARFAVFDNVVVGVGTNSFDVRLFETIANVTSQISGIVSWVFEGI